MECQHEFHHGILAACINIKNAFDSVHCEELLDLHLHSIPARIVGLLTRDRECCEVLDGGVSSFVPVTVE